MAAKPPPPQINVRAPAEARDTLLRAGAHLRADPDFLGKLQEFLDGYEVGRTDPTLAERVASLEAAVRRLAGQ